MASKSDRIQINCKYEDYELIHRAVVAAAVVAKADGNSQLRMALAGVLLRLGESEGLSAHHLSNLDLWDVSA